MTRPIRILQVITSFGDDAPSQGAAGLAKCLDPSEFQVTAVSLRARQGPMPRTVADLERVGIEHVSLGMGGFLDGRILPRLVRLMRWVCPDIVHTHAFRSDFWAGLAARLAGVPVFASSIRNCEWDCFGRSIHF